MARRRLSRKNERKKEEDCHWRLQNDDGNEQTLKWNVENDLVHFPLSIQCDQVGRFLKVLGDKFSYKSGPCVDFLILLNASIFMHILICLLFGQI